MNGGAVAISHEKKKCKRRNVECKISIYLRPVFLTNTSHVFVYLELFGAPYINFLNFFTVGQASVCGKQVIGRCIGRNVYLKSYA